MKVQNLAISFQDGSSALRDVSIAVRPAEFVSIVGPSGCGKSTLLRAIAGLQEPSSGEVDSDDSRISFVFQDPTLLPWLSAIGNVELPLRLAGESPTDTRQRSIEALRDVGLEEHAHKLPRQLSGGMRMRVSVARALVTKPDVFLFDEPFAAVDEIKREFLNDMLLRLHEERRFSALFVTHSVTEAVYLADRVLVFSQGPGHIIDDVRIPLERPRHREQRYGATYIDLCHRISDSLRLSGEAL